MSNYQIRAGEVFESFATLGDWTTGGTAGGALTIETDFVTDGASSLKLVTAGGASSNYTGTKTVNRSFANDEVVIVDLYIPDLTKILAPIIYLSNDSSFTDYFSYSMNTGTLHRGFNRIPINRTAWTANGSASWDNNIVRLRVRCDAVSGQVGTLYYCQITAGKYGRPKIVFRFDDIRDSQYYVAYPIMREHGFRGSCFVITDRIGASGGYMTLAQMRVLHDAGWDMCNHTKSHTDLSTLTLNEQKAELANCADILKNLGFSRRNEHLHCVWPFGGSNTSTQTAMRAVGMLSGGSILSPLSTPYPILNPYYLTIDNISFTTTLENAMARVDRVIADGSQSCFMFHIIKTTPGGSTEWATADFRALCEYISARRDQVDVVTWTEFYDQMTTSRKNLSDNSYPLNL